MNSNEVVRKISRIKNPPISDYKLEHLLKLSLKSLGIDHLNIL